MDRLHLFYRRTRSFGWRFIRGIKEPINLSIHACEHCNLNCAGCTPYSPIAEEEYCDLTVLEKSLSKLSHFEKSFGQIKIVGGEPLLNPDLSKMLEIVRTYLKTRRIVLWTNGLLFLQPHRLPKDLWPTCRENKIEIRITKYPIKVDYNKILDIVLSQNVKSKIYIDREFTWSRMHHHINGNNNLAIRSKIFKLWQCPSFNCLQLYENKIFACAQVAYIKHLNKKFGLNFLQHKRDYIAVDDINNIKVLRKLILFSTPFCNYCGAAYTSVKWDYSQKLKEEWVHE